MNAYIEAFVNAFKGTVDWTINSITFQVPFYQNYFWGLVLLSLVVWGLEIAFPWRKNQPIIRKDFWLDAFYMFFNFFLFAIVIEGFYADLKLLFGHLGITMQSLAIVHIGHWPVWLQLLVFFVVLDFVQWFTHILLHKVPAFWQFHKVHHSVEQMGFAAHLRYHWMENILYKPLKTLGLMVLGGVEPQLAYAAYFLAIAIGHLNHANVKITWGPLKYIFNNPVMHLWHHAAVLPKGQTSGVNFGISLSLWDYLFKTNYIPNENGNIPLGFDGLKQFPKSFWGQLVYGFGKKSANRK
ncbi:sterol desaturase [bacterium]|nr:sterol desaturase [bacterium]